MNQNNFIQHYSYIYPCLFLKTIQPCSCIQNASILCFLCQWFTHYIDFWMSGQVTLYGSTSWWPITSSIFILVLLDSPVFRAFLFMFFRDALLFIITNQDTILFFVFVEKMWLPQHIISHTMSHPIISHKNTVNTHHPHKITDQANQYNQWRRLSLPVKQMMLGESTTAVHT